MVNTDESYIKLLRLHGYSTTFKLNPIPKDVLENDWSKLGFENLVDKIKAESSDNVRNQSIQQILSKFNVLESTFLLAVLVNKTKTL